MRHWWGLSIFAYLIIGATSAAAIVAGEVADIHERLRVDKSYQFEFSQSPPPQPTPNWMQAIAKFLASFFELLSPLIKLFFWLGIALIVLGTIYYIGREIYLRTRKADNKDTQEVIQMYQPAASLAHALLEEADRHAANGNFGEAIRILLFRSIEDIQKFQPNYVRSAMTSREISHLPILQPQARSAFSQIAAAVEKNHFAGKMISVEIFQDCRAAYTIFAMPESWS